MIVGVLNTSDPSVLPIAMEALIMRNNMQYCPYTVVTKGTANKHYQLAPEAKWSAGASRWLVTNFLISGITSTKSCVTLSSAAREIPSMRNDLLMIFEYSRKILTTS